MSGTQAAAAAQPAQPKIRRNVGKGGHNSIPDVLVVQGLLNQCLGLLVPLAPITETGNCDFLTIFAIEEFQRRIVKLSPADGRVDPGGHTFEALVTCAAGKPYTPKQKSSGGGKYTNSPLEEVTTKTTPTARDVIAVLKTNWSDLSEDGARTLTAQFMHETGGGVYCFNWNLGNVKAGPNEPHMYLKGVWEVVGSESAAESEVTKANGLAHVASADEIKKHGWSHPAGSAVVVFDPPHPQSRFRAYASLSDGAQRWIGLHKRIAQKYANYLKDVNAGDCAAVAKTLKQASYYTGSESDYARNMTQIKKKIDAELGKP
jgi:hypothetical protein